MSSLSLSLKSTLAACALAGVTMLACGDDPAPATKSDDGPSSAKQDAGTPKKDAGTSKKDAGAVVPQGEPGEDCEGSARAQCTGCDSEPCFVTCEDGSYGDCVSLVGAIKDGGIKLPPIVTDAGEFTASDGQVSVKVGDSSVVIPPMACPAPLVCSSTSMALSGALISGLAGGAAACIANDAVGFPPACTTAAECTTAGLKLSQCLMGYCIQICK
jgi:hypothetical protein